MKFRLLLMVAFCIPLIFAYASIFSPPKLRSMNLFRAKDIMGTPPTPVEIAEHYGYKTETHTVTTFDGYILTMHRVQNSSVKITEPFILQHGLSLNTGQWVVLQPSQNLALMLADAGYDIWMTNIRGNMYSRKHERLSPDTGAFWDYGWHEHGTIDMPAMIDYILAQTGYKQLFYIGHSMGTTMFFVMTSMRPEYNAKIKHMFALAPVAYCGNMQAFLREFGPPIRTFQEIIKSTLNNHLPAELIVFQLGKMGLCSMGQSMCGNVMDTLAGFNPKSNATVQEALYRYFPDAVSNNQIAHYAQQINNPDTFRLFDYGEQQNQEKYGNPTPPDYPVHKISAPITLIYSQNDFLAATVDVEKFSRNLRNAKLFLVPDPKFNHFDYIISTYAREMVYTPLLQIANSYRAKFGTNFAN